MVNQNFYNGLRRWSLGDRRVNRRATKGSSGVKWFDFFGFGCTLVSKVVDVFIHFVWLAEVVARGGGTGIHRVLSACLRYGRRHGAPRECTILSTICDVSKRFALRRLSTRLAGEGFQIDETALCGAVRLFVRLELIVERDLISNAGCRTYCCGSDRVRRIYDIYKRMARVGIPTIATTIGSLGLRHFQGSAFTLCVCNMYDAYRTGLAHGGGSGWWGWLCCFVRVGANGMSILLNLR